MIDFAAIAAAYRAGFATQTHGWPTLFDRMEKLLERLTDTSGEAERATRAYPVLRYRDGSVGVRISLGAGALGADALGGAGLADGAGRGLAEGLTAGSRQFVAGFGQVGAMVEQELALPRGMSVLADLAAAVDASLARFEHADASMFDDRARRFSDVFGLAGLGWRALQGPQAQDQLRRAAFRFGHGVEFFRSLSPPGGAAGPAVTDPTERMEALGAAIDEQAQLTLGALLLLPTASEALDVLLGAGVLAAEESILSAVVGIERDVQALRASVVDAWLAAFDIGATLHALASAADLVLSLDSSLLTGALPLWLDALLDGVEVMLDGIRAWGAWTTAMVGAFQVATDDLMGVDLMPWVVRNVLGDFVADHVPLPNVTLDDVIRLATGEGNLALRDDLDDFFGAVDKLLWGVDLVHDVSGLRRKAADLRQIVGLTLSPTPFTYPPDVLPAGPLAGFPDAYAAVFGGSARADLLASVRTLGGQLQRSVHDMGIAGRDLAAGLATAAESELDRQTQLGAGLALRNRWATEGALVDGLVRPLRTDLDERSAGAPAEPLADSFDAWLAGASGASAISAATAAIPAYVGEMRRFWSARSARSEHPTSAHLLARHGRLALVHVPRLSLDAKGRRADGALAVQVADGFHDVVLDSYRRGRDRMAVSASHGGGGGHGR